MTVANSDDLKTKDICFSQIASLVMNNKNKEVSKVLSPEALHDLTPRCEHSWS